MSRSRLHYLLIGCIHQLERESDWRIYRTCCLVGLFKSSSVTTVTWSPLSYQIVIEGVMGVWVQHEQISMQNNCDNKGCKKREMLWDRTYCCWRIMGPSERCIILTCILSHFIERERFTSFPTAVTPVMWQSGHGRIYIKMIIKKYHLIQTGLSASRLSVPFSIWKKGSFYKSTMKCLSQEGHLNKKWNVPPARVQFCTF